MSGMTPKQAVLAAMAGAAALSAFLTATIVWLWMTEPVRVAAAVTGGDALTFVRALAKFFIDALSLVIRYL
jgi:hypothetical protein